MASNLSVTKALVDDHILVTASLVDGSTLPGAIFIYENNGDGTLGSFFGTCGIDELRRLAVLTLGTPQPKFGNRYVRHTEAKILVPVDQNADEVIAALVKNVKALSLAYSNQTSSTLTFLIP